MEIYGKELLINARQITHSPKKEIYEFILNHRLEVIDCVKIESLLHGKVRPIHDIQASLEGMLFELNHVRVNPEINNYEIIRNLVDAWEAIGVQVENPPNPQDMAVCFKPLGEINEIIRFYLKNDFKLIFLCPNMRPKLVS